MEGNDTRGTFNVASKSCSSLTSFLRASQEQQHYLDTTTDKGNEKLNFRFSY